MGLGPSFGICGQDTSLLVPHCLLSSYRLPSSRSPSYATSAGSWSSLVWNTANDRYNFMIFKLGVSRYPNLERSSHNPDGKSLLDFFVTKIILRYFWLVCGLEIQLWWKNSWSPQGLFESGPSSQQKEPHPNNLNGNLKIHEVRNLFFKPACISGFLSTYLFGVFKAPRVKWILLYLTS